MSISTQCCLAVSYQTCYCHNWQAVLKFTVSQNVSHLPVLSRQQMKKDVSAAHCCGTWCPNKKGRHTPLTFNILTAFGIHWQNLTASGTHLFLMPKAPQLHSVVSYIQCLFNSNWSCPTSHLKIIWDLIVMQKGVHPETHKSYVWPAKYPVSQKRYFHMVQVSLSRRPPRQAIVSVTFIIRWSKCITEDEQSTFLFCLLSS